MKILIDGQTLLTPEIHRGIGKYFLNVVENILSVDFTNDFYLVAPSGSESDAFTPWAREKLNVIEPSQNGHAIKNEDALTQSYSDSINDLISKTGIDVYWSPNALMDSVLLPARHVNHCRYSVTIFDLIPLVMEDHFKKAWPAKVFARYRKKLARLETDYDLFLHISQHTYADFTARLAVNQKSHAITPLAAADFFRPYPFPKIVDAEDYVLYPGGFDPRKNMFGALEAFAELHEHHGNDPAVRGTRLRIVCHADEASEKDLRKRARRLGINDKLDVTGFVTDAELVELYQKARCLFFPSLYEGFGLPVLEALACGLPVAASNTSSIPEVGGDMALYFNPYDVKDMAEKLYSALQQPDDIASQMCRHARARTFSWTKTAMATIDAWNKTPADTGE